MQENLNSKKRSYLSLTLLVSCAMSSAYGMNSFSNYFSGLRSYLPGFRNNNQDTSAELENDDQEELVASRINQTPEVDPVEQRLYAELERRHRERVERNYALQRQLVPSVSSSVSLNEQNSFDINNSIEAMMAEQRLSAEVERRAKKLQEEREFVQQRQLVSVASPFVSINEQHDLDNNNPVEEQGYDSQEEEQPLRDSRYDNGNFVEEQRISPDERIEYLGEDRPHVSQRVRPAVSVDEALEGVAGSFDERTPKFNALANAMNKLKRHKKLAAGTGIVAVGAGAYVLRKPIARLYQKAKLNAQAAWQKLQNKKVTKGAALKGAFGLAGTAATAYAARTAYQNPEAVRNLLSNRKTQLGTLGILAAVGGAKLAHNYMTKNNAAQPDIQAVNERNMMIEEFIATFTEEQWKCSGTMRAIDAFYQGNVALGIEIIADSDIVLTDTQAQKFQDIIDTINS